CAGGNTNSSRATSALSLVRILRWYGLSDVSCPRLGRPRPIADPRSPERRQTLVTLSPTGVLCYYPKVAAARRRRYYATALKIPGIKNVLLDFCAKHRKTYFEYFGLTVV
ncbi:unnamed protein product, partial [Laminaria digitata]